ncbi:hypothetical protein QL285_029021 [Trifolium repens]|nr:hypothetical protein QL285_029021 [Trifolium repens]
MEVLIGVVFASDLVWGGAGGDGSELDVVVAAPTGLRWVWVSVRRRYHMACALSLSVVLVAAFCPVGGWLFRRGFSGVCSWGFTGAFWCGGGAFWSGGGTVRSSGAVFVGPGGGLRRRRVWPVVTPAKSCFRWVRVALFWWWLSVSVMVMMAPPSRSWRHRVSSVVILSMRLLTAVALLALFVSGVGSGVGVLLWC